MASVDVTMHLVAPVVHATSVSVTLAPSYTTPVAAGTVLSSIIVAPGNWTGTLALSGPDAASFVINTSGTSHVLAVGPADLVNPADLQFTVTATP